MHLIEIFLPLYDNEGQRLPEELFEQVRAVLVSKFGGITAFVRSPAKGIWKEEPGAAPVKDDIVIFEVMVDKVDARWWNAYKDQLLERFRQQEMVIRSSNIKLF